MTKTAVFPRPDLAWHRTSVPTIACGMQTCWTVGEDVRVCSSERFMRASERAERPSIVQCFYDSHYIPSSTLKTQEPRL